jgi:hypothetical protein
MIVYFSDIRVMVGDSSHRNRALSHTEAQCHTRSSRSRLAPVVMIYGWVYVCRLLAAHAASESQGGAHNVSANSERDQYSLVSI